MSQRLILCQGELHQLFDTNKRKVNLHVQKVSSCAAPISAKNALYNSGSVLETTCPLMFAHSFEAPFSVVVIAGFIM